MDHERLGRLSELGRLLDQAIDIADACGETLLGAQIAQALHLLDTRVSQSRPVSVTDATEARSDNGAVKG